MDKQKKHILSRIGTSNIVLPVTKSSFPDNFKNASRLHYYSSIFNTVEVNSTFYKISKKATFGKWSMDVQDDFQFTLKLWPDITHGQQLKYEVNNIKIFINAADGIGYKKGCLLIQFPGKITLDYYRQVEALLKELNDWSEWKKVVEFRSSTWYIEEVYEMLDAYNASAVLHDMPASKHTAMTNKAVFVYYRFHGPQGDYKGGYSNDFLQKKAREIYSLQKQGKEVWVYFNNTIGDAFENAITLKKLMADMTGGGR